MAEDKARRIADYAAGLRAPKVHNRSTYVNWGCRCDECVLDTQLANRDRRVPYRRRRKQDRGRD